MKKKKNKNNSIAGIFVKSLLKSILGIIVLLTVGFVSYKVSYMILSNNSSGIGNSSDNIKDIIEDAQTDKVSKNLIYVCDDKKLHRFSPFKDEIITDLSPEIDADELDTIVVH